MLQKEEPMRLRFVSLFLSLVVVASCGLSSCAAGAPESSFEELDLSALSAEQEHDAGLSQLVSQLQQADSDLILTGTAYVATSTDAAGNLVKYYLVPQVTNFYVDCSHFGGTSEWYTQLVIYECVTVNGEVQSSYENRIKLTDITGSITAGENIDFSDASVTPAQAGSPVISSDRRSVSCSFDSDAAMNSSGDALLITATSSTTDPNQEQSVSVPVEFRWAGSVYSGNSYVGDVTLEKCYSVLANNAD